MKNLLAAFIWPQTLMILAKFGTLGYNPLAIEKKSLVSMVKLSI
jgi:hypothetical protein